MKTEVFDIFRKKGFIGVFSKISHESWRAWTHLYLAPQLGALGARTVVRNPLFLSNPRGITIGSDVFIRDGARLEVVDRPGEAPGRLRIGNRVSMEQGVHIAACGIIEIADDVCLAARVSILDGSHPAGFPGDGNRVNHLEAGPAYVRIGSRAFIGAGATILRNVSVGDNAIVGAGAVVVRDVPDNAVVVGSPARIVKMLPTHNGDR